MTAGGGERLRGRGSQTCGTVDGAACSGAWTLGPFSLLGVVRVWGYVLPCASEGRGVWCWRGTLFLWSRSLEDGRWERHDGGELRVCGMGLGYGVGSIQCTFITGVNLGRTLDALQLPWPLIYITSSPV